MVGLDFCALEKRDREDGTTLRLVQKEIRRISICIHCRPARCARCEAQTLRDLAMQNETRQKFPLKLERKTLSLAISMLTVNTANRLTWNVC